MDNYANKNIKITLNAIRNYTTCVTAINNNNIVDPTPVINKRTELIQPIENRK